MLRGLAVLAIHLCAGCDLLFQVERVGAAAEQPPNVVASTTDDCTDCDALSLDVTVQSGRDHPLLIVSVAISLIGQGTSPPVTAVTLGDASFEFVARGIAMDGPNQPVVEQWLLVDPSPGVGSVQVMIAGTAETIIASVVEIEGASADPVRSSASAGSIVMSKSADIMLASRELDLVIDTVCAGTSVDSPGPAQTLVYVENLTSTTTCGNLASSTIAGASTVSLHWGVNNAFADHWVQVATSLRPGG